MRKDHRQVYTGHIGKSRHLDIGEGEPRVLIKRKIELSLPARVRITINTNRPIVTKSSGAFCLLLNCMSYCARVYGMLQFFVKVSEEKRKIIGRLICQRFRVTKRVTLVSCVCITIFRNGGL